MKKIAVLGLGHIGKRIHDSLENCIVSGYDLSTGIDLRDVSVLDRIAQENDGIVAATPFFLNKAIADACFKHGKAYFDLTESNEVAKHIGAMMGAGSPMVTQCGLAPGMVSIIANNMASKFQRVKSIAIRVGAVPSLPNNHMGYNLTWNTEGLINEYIHPCKALVDGRLVTLEPLDGQEPVNFNGIELEAANTSGGLGSLAESWIGLAESVTYKTLRYPGHWEFMRFLKNDLCLKDNFDAFVKIFNTSIPHVTQDKVFILIKVQGFMRNNPTALVEKSYSTVITNSGTETAIQISTASGILAVVDAWRKGALDGMTGLVKQEDLPFDAIVSSRHSECYGLSLRSLINSMG